MDVKPGADPDERSAVCELRNADTEEMGVAVLEYGNVLVVC